MWELSKSSSIRRGAVALGWERYMPSRERTSSRPCTCWKGKGNPDIISQMDLMGDSDEPNPEKISIASMPNLRIGKGLELEKGRRLNKARPQL